MNKRIADERGVVKINFDNFAALLFAFFRIDGGGSGLRNV